MDLDLLYFFHGSRGGVKCAWAWASGTPHTICTIAALNRLETRDLTLVASDKGIRTGKVAKFAYLWSECSLLERCHHRHTDGMGEEELHWKMNASWKKNSLGRNLPVLLKWHPYSTSYRHVSKCFPAFDSTSLSAHFFSHLAINPPVKDDLHCDDFKIQTIFKGSDWIALELLLRHTGTQGFELLNQPLFCDYG